MYSLIGYLSTEDTCNPYVPGLSITSRTYVIHPVSHEFCRDTVSMNSLPPVTEPGADKDTSFLVPWVEQHWSIPCVSHEVSSRTEPQFPIVTSCLQTIYFVVAYLLVCLFQFFASFTVVLIIISQTNNLDKSLTQGLFPGKFNLIHIIKIFFYCTLLKYTL